ncbi:MAG: AsmA family protein [Alphaproteobacteria bacterium]
MARRAWLIGVPAALVAAGVVAWLAFDPKQFVEGKLAEAFGQAVRIETLSYDLGTVTAVRITDLLVNGEGSDAPAKADIREIELSVRLWPLLRDELVIEELRVRDGRVRLDESDLTGVPEPRLARVADVRMSAIGLHLSYAGHEVDVWLEQFGAKRDGARTALDGSGRIGAAPDRLAPFEVKGTLGSPGEVTGGSRYGTRLQGTLGDSAIAFDGEVAAAELTGKATIDSLELADLLALIGIEMAPIGPVKGTATLAGQGELLAARDIDLLVGGDGGALQGHISGKVDDVGALRGVELTFTASAPDVAALTPLLGQAPMLGGGLDAEGRIADADGRLTIPALTARLTLPEHYDITVKGSIGGLPFRDADLTVSGSVSQVPDLPPALAAYGPYTVAGRLVGDGDKLRLSDLAVENTAGQGLRLRASGSIGNVLDRTDVALQVTVAAPSLAALDASMPADSGAVSAEMAVVPGEDGAIEFSDATFKVGEMALTGKATYRPGDALTGEFHVPHLVLDKLLAGGGTGERVFSEVPLPFGALAVLDADVTLVADAISIGEHRGDKVTMRMVTAGGNVRLDMAPFAFDGGEIGATVEIDVTASPPTLRLETRGTGVKLGVLSALTKQPTALSGRADIDIRVAGRGDSPHAIAANLAGEAALVAADGTIESELINLIAADLATEIFSQATDSRASTPMQCLLANFSIHRGLADAKALFLSTDKIIVTGEGRVNLGAERYDLSLLPAPKEPSLFSLAQRVNVTGPLSDPSVTPDAGSLAWSAVQALVGNALLPGAGLLLPMLSIGNGDEHPCAREVRSMPKERDVVDKATDAASGAVKAVGGAAESVGDAVGGAVKGLGKLFK